MRKAHLRKLGVVGVILALWLGHPTVQAHPHHWIDVFAEWQFDPDGMIAGVRLRWLFDDYYSVLLANDVDPTDEGLQSILETVMSNTAQHQYFLQIEQQGEKAALGVAEQARIDVRAHRIEIEFLLPIQAPLDPERGDITYQIAEPTYYFEMLHAEDGPAIVLKDAPENCRYHLQAPRPDAALIAYAASLGIDESGGNELGIQFAETVTLRCE